MSFVMQDARSCAYGAAPPSKVGEMQLPSYYTLCTWATPERIKNLPTWLQNAAQRNSLNPLDCVNCPTFKRRGTDQ